MAVDRVQSWVQHHTQAGSDAAKSAACAGIGSGLLIRRRPGKPFWRARASCRGFSKWRVIVARARQRGREGGASPKQTAKRPKKTGGWMGGGGRTIADRKVTHPFPGSRLFAENFCLTLHHAVHHCVEFWCGERGVIAWLFGRHEEQQQPERAHTRRAAGTIGGGGACRRSAARRRRPARAARLVGPCRRVGSGTGGMNRSIAKLISQAPADLADDLADALAAL